MEKEPDKTQELPKISDLCDFSHLALTRDFGWTHIERVFTGHATNKRLDSHYVRDWFVGCGFLSGGQSAIIIPIYGLEQMSDADLISNVRASFDLAITIDIEKDLRDGNETLECEDLCDITLEQFTRYYQWKRKLWEPYRFRSNLINDAYNKLELYWNCKNEESGFIYCLSDQQGHYKIGRTKQLTSRIKQLSIQLPFKPILVCAFRVIDTLYYEHMLHEEYSDKRINGEWFSLLDDDLQAFIKKHAGSNYVTEKYLQSLELSGSTQLLTGNVQ